MRLRVCTRKRRVYRFYELARALIGQRTLPRIIYSR